MRTCSLDRAEQCLREALAIDPGHQDALLALGCLLWHSGLHTDAAFLQQAAVLLLHAKDDLLAAHPVAAAMAQEQQVLPGTEPQPAEEQQGQPGLAGRPPPASSPRGGVQQSVAVVWALLGLVYGAAGQDEERRNCSFEAYRLGLLQLQGALASQPLLQVCYSAWQAQCWLFCCHTGHLGHYPANAAGGPHLSCCGHQLPSRPAVVCCSGKRQWGTLCGRQHLRESLKHRCAGLLGSVCGQPEPHSLLK